MKSVGGSARRSMPLVPTISTIMCAVNWSWARECWILSMVVLVSSFVFGQQAPDPALIFPIPPSNSQLPIGPAGTEAPRGPSTANAGKGKASLKGTVNDPTQAVVAGAAAVLNGPNGLHLEVTSNDKGEYAFLGLAAGSYALIVTAPNFAPNTFDQINLTADQELELDVSLEVQKAATKIEVESSEANQVQLETSTVSGTISEKQVTTFGLNGRNFSQLIALAPGVSNQTGQDEAKVGVVGSVKYSVNGGRVEYNTFEVDGSDVLNTGLNGASTTLMVYPSLDAIQEVKVLTSNYGAQFGRTASGTVLVTTKSGTPQFHASVYEFIRNEFFNSRNFFDVTSTKAPLYRRQDFGGNLGGPLIIPKVYTKKDKTFFFFSEEVRLEKTPTEYNQAVPSLKERGLIMTPQGIQKNLVNFGGATSQAYDFSDVCPPAGTGSSFSRQQYPDCPSVSSINGIPQVLNSNGIPNVLPAGFVNKNAAAILNSNLIPLPNSAVGCDYFVPSPDPADPNHCYDSVVSPSTYWREELFKIDHNFTLNHKLTFRYIHDAWDTTVLTPQWGVVHNTFPSVENRFVGPGTSLVAQFTSVLSQTMVHDLVLSYTNSNITLDNKNGPGGAQFQRDPSLDQPLVLDPSKPGQCNPLISADPASGVPQCAMGYIFNNGFGGKMPGVQFLGTNAAYGGRGFAVDPSYMPWSHTNPTFSIRDSLSKSKGKHTLQFGAQLIYAQRNQTNNAIGAASGDLQGLLTFSNLSNSTGNAFADFLLEQRSGTNITGFIQSYTQDSSQQRYYQRYKIAEPYFQDDWKVTSRFTLNLGLRLSLFGTYSEKNHNAWNWEASRFNSARFAADSFSGALLDKNTGAPVPFNASTFQLDPGVVKDLGLVQCGVNGVPSGCMQGHLFNPAPRIGFAWDPKGDGKTSIRAGYGIFFEHGTGNEANTGSLEASSPVVLSMTQPNPLNYSCIGNVGYGAGVNSICNNGLHVAPPQNSVYPLNVTSIPTKAVWPYAQQWSLGVQRDVGHDLIVDIAYVGSKGTHLTVERQLNQAVPLPLSLNPFGPHEPLLVSECQAAGTGGLNAGMFVLQDGTTITPQNPAYVYMEAACAGTPGLPNVNSLPNRPYPGLGQIFSLQNVANSTYNALQLKLQRTRGALTGGLVYSYSHSIDTSSDRSDPILANSYDLAQNRASSDFDQRQSLTINSVYQLPNPIAVWKKLTACDPNQDSECPESPANVMTQVDHSLFGGWELAGIIIAQSGTPFTVINSAGNTGVSLTDNAGVASGLGLAASFPDIAPKDYGLLFPGSNYQSFGPLLDNPSKFIAPRGLTFGDAGRNFLNNPGRWNVDLTLRKRHSLGENAAVEFRAEVFNVFNHTEFRIYDPDNPGSTGNNVVSCYGGPDYSAGYNASGVNCVNGASFLHPLNAHRPRTMQFGVKFYIKP